MDYKMIEESLKSLKLFNGNKREGHVEKLLDYYNGNNVSNYISSLFEADAFSEIPPYASNITKKFINKMSRIYTIGAVRNVNKRYDSITFLKNARMKHIERATRLIGTVATRVLWNQPEEGSAYFDYRPIYYFYPFFDDDPFTPSSLCYPLMQPIDDVSRSDGSQYIHWDDTLYTIFDENGNILEEKEHGYGVLPFVFTHRENQTDSFYVEGANDVVNCNEHVNIAMTEMQLGLRFQMFGQPVATGADLGEKQRFGSNVTIELPEGATYNIVAPEGKVMDVIENIRWQIELVATNNHLWVQWAQQGGEVPSGLSLMIKDLEAHNDYQDDIALWRLYEAQLYDVERKIAKSRNISLPGMESFGIDFNEPEYPKSVQDQIQWDKHRLELGIISEAQLYKEYNDDVTLEEAEVIVAENKQKNQKLTIFEAARQRAETTTEL
tara:strand:+ start:4432 stop:5745 length:1314 start_codon:yes stop_codon:yes gene_type:complete